MRVYGTQTLTNTFTAANFESQHANPAYTLYISIMTVKLVCLLLHLPYFVALSFLCAALTEIENTFGRRSISLLTY